MKKLFLFVSMVPFLISVSCKKDEIGMPAITGVLYTGCGGSVVAGATVSLVRDAVVTPSILQPDYPAEIMESAITDANGFFKFTKYHSEGWNMTVTFETAGSGAQGLFTGIPDRNLGNLYLNGFISDATLIWKRGAVPFKPGDSITYAMPEISKIGTVYYSSPDSMKAVINGMKFYSKQLYPSNPESYLKFRQYIAYQLFNGNPSNNAKSTFLYITECQTSFSILIDSSFQ